MKITKYLAFSILAIIMIILAAGTFIEKNGSKFDYSSPWIIALWSIMLMCAITYIVHRRLYRRPPAFILHGAFVVILGGALTTWCTQIRGHISLTINEEQSHFTSSDGTTVQLPFSISLSDFEIVNYPGTSTPANFISHISLQYPDDNQTISHTVAMNQPITVDGYRFCQSSYSTDGLSSTLTVDFDPYGSAITLLGYIMLLISVLAIFFSRKTGLRTLICNLRSSITIISIVATAFCSNAADAPKVLPKQLANNFCDLMVLYNCRITSLHTIAFQFTSKLHGKPSYNGLSPQQVFASWIFFPEQWNDEPIIKIKSINVQQALGSNSKYVSARQLYFWADSSYFNSTISTDVADTIDKILMVRSLTEGEIMKIFPYSHLDNFYWYSYSDTIPYFVNPDKALFINGSMSHLASLIITHKYNQANSVISKFKKYQLKECGNYAPEQWRLNAERFYLSIYSFTHTAASVFLIIGILLLITFIRNQIISRKTSLTALSTICCLLSTAYISINLALIWIVSRHLPMTNGYETMLLMAWIASIIALCFYRNRFSLLVSAIALIIIALCMFVAGISGNNPYITNLMPVLQSPLLCLHVLCIMIAYTILCIIVFISLSAIIIRIYSANDSSIISQLAIINRIFLYPAVMLLSIGIFLGAIWANISWGRYWAWDPKEVWALITMIIYAMPIHSASLSQFVKPMFLHIYLVAAIISVAITYFGVNMFLGGMHSYA